MLDLPRRLSRAASLHSHVKDDFYNKFKPKEWDEVHVLYFFGTRSTDHSHRQETGKKTGGSERDEVQGYGQACGHAEGRRRSPRGA